MNIKGAFMFLRKILKKIISILGYEIYHKQNTPPHSNCFSYKYDAELNYWIERYNAENHVFANEHYKRLMLGMAQESNDTFLNDKIVVDFGCGPRGSLVWTKVPKLRIGVDVLVDKYYGELLKTSVF
jgi:hypothetical protein